MMTSRIDNPNRVGSGFINLGPQERNFNPAVNWQTQGLLGGGAAAPQGVADIWGSSAAPAPVPSQQQRLAPPPPQMQPLGGQPESVQPFAAAPAPPRDVNAIFSALNLDAGPQQMGQPPKPPTSYLGGGAPGASAYAGMGVNNMSAGALQQPFMNGGVAPSQVPGAPQQSLMTLLQQQAQAPVAAPPSFAPVYGGLGNSAGMPQAGMAGANRMQAAFGNGMPAPPQCQLPQNGMPMNGGAHAAAFAANAFAPSTSRQPPPAAAQPAAAGPAQNLGNRGRLRSRRAALQAAARGTGSGAAASGGGGHARAGAEAGDVEAAAPVERARRREGVGVLALHVPQPRRHLGVRDVWLRAARQGGGPRDERRDVSACAGAAAGGRRLEECGKQQCEEGGVA